MRLQKEEKLVEERKEKTWKINKGSMTNKDKAWRNKKVKKS